VRFLFLLLFAACSGKAAQAPSDAAAAAAAATATATDAAAAAAADAATAPAAASRSGILLIALHTDELLGSENKALDWLAGAIAKATNVTVTRADASDRAVLTDPARWAAADAVVVVEVLPPTGKKPKRISSGVGDLLVVRDGQVVASEQITGVLGDGLADPRLTDFLVGAVTP
jgi:hypothetical protein